MSIFYQHSHATLKYCSNVIYESGYKLRSLRWEIGASLIRYRIDKSSKPLWKINKLTSSNVNELIKTILDFFIQNSFLNGPKKLVFVRMYGSNIIGVVGPPYPYCSLVAFCAFAWLRLCAFGAFGACKIFS